MCVVDGKQVSPGVVRAAFAWISEVFEAVKRGAVAPLLRVLHAYQVFLAEAVVDLDVELIVVAMVRSRSDPVVVNAISLNVRLRKVAHHLLRNRVDQISLYPRRRLKVGRQSWAPWAGVSSEVVEGNKSIAAIPNRRAHIGVVRALIRIPDLPGGNAAQPLIVERSALRGADLAEIAGTHQVARHAGLRRTRRCRA